MSEGEQTCPLADWKHRDTGKDVVSYLGRCGENLHVVWSASMGIEAGVESHAPEDAWYRTWQVECESGHVILRCEDDGDGARQPFEPSMLAAATRNKEPHD